MFRSQHQPLREAEKVSRQEADVGGEIVQGMIGGKFARYEEDRRYDRRRVVITGGCKRGGSSVPSLPTIHLLSLSLPTSHPHHPPRSHPLSIALSIYIPTARQNYIFYFPYHSPV